MPNSSTPPDDITITDPRNATITMRVKLKQNGEAKLVAIDDNNAEVSANTYVIVATGTDIGREYQLTVLLDATSDFSTLEVTSSGNPWRQPDPNTLEVTETLNLSTGIAVEDQPFTVTATDTTPEQKKHILDPYIRLQRTNYQVYPGTTSPEPRSTG